jgi:oligopeptide/dipeptide ABC transporter ATP-binding protein
MTTNLKDEILSIKNLCVTYKLQGGSLDAVKDLNFGLSNGEVLGIIGESGAGKSTVGWGILGMIEPPHVCSGEILNEGRNVLGMDQHDLTEYRWKKVAMIFQSAMNSLDPVISIGKNFSQLLLDKGVVVSKTEAKQKTSELLKIVGLRESVADMYPFELSGGMKQRVSIAMALAASPRVLVADEPTTALDTITQFSVLSLLLDLRRQGKIGSMILISHDLSVQAYMVDYAMVMLKGRLVERGTKAEIFKDPKHPYTKFLMSSLSLGQDKIPKLTRHEEAPTAAGCPFASFCPYVMQRCLKEFPEMTGLSDTRSVACFLYGG